MTEHEFKTHFRNQKMSLNNKSYFKSTALSKYVWEVKEAKKPFSIKWSIQKRASAYRSGAKTCYLFPKGIVNTRLTTHLKKKKLKQC